MQWYDACKSVCVYVTFISKCGAYGNWPKLLYWMIVQFERTGISIEFNSQI